MLLSGSTGVRTMRISTLIVAAAMMLTALSAGGRADTSTGGPTHITGRGVVYYGDLNPKTEQDAKILFQRIKSAAKRACGGHATFSTYTGGLDPTFEECRSNAVQRAVKQ